MARRLGLSGVAPALRAAEALLGAEVAAEPGTVGICPSTLLDRVVPERCVAVAIASSDDPLRRRFLVELEAAMARALVDRLLGAAEPTPIEAPLAEGEAGVLLYLAARLLAELGGSHRVVAVLGSRAGLRKALDEGDLAFWPVRVRVGARSGVATEGTLRVWLSEPSGASVESPPSPSPAPAALAALPVGLRLFRGRARLRVDELGELDVGDAILFDEAAEEGELFAEVEGSRRALLRCRLDGSNVVVQEIVPGRDAGRRRGGKAMSQADAEGGLALAGDVEVELTVDVARLRLRLGELARIRPGEVLGTGVEVGERVRVRAGELDVAEGELVDVDGKLGVLVTKVFPTACA